MVLCWFIYIYIYITILMCMLLSHRLSTGILCVWCLGDRFSLALANLELRDLLSAGLKACTTVLIFGEFDLWLACHGSHH